MDNGSNDVSHTMLGTGRDAAPMRLWWVRLDDEPSIRSTEISGLPYGTESNPPAWDPVGRVVVAYDSGNAVLRAWRMEGDELAPALAARRLRARRAHHRLPGHARARRRRLARAAQPGEPARARRDAGDAAAPLARGAAATRRRRLRGGDELVVLDLDTGAEKGARRCAVADAGLPVSRARASDRDIYYQSITTIARVAVGSLSRAAGPATRAPLRGRACSSRSRVPPRRASRAAAAARAPPSELRGRALSRSSRLRASIGSASMS